MDQILSYLSENFLSHLNFDFLDLIEIAIIVFFVLFVYKKYIQGTHSEKFVKGIVVLIFAWAFSECLIAIRLNIIGIFLKTIISIIVFSFVVVFQPELRKLLGYLGQTGFMKRDFFKISNPDAIQQVVSEVIETVKYCSKIHRGLLIVFSKYENDILFSDVGTKLNADVSNQLLLTIFHPNTPLHDGAVIITDDKIVSAGVLLPLTEDPKLSWKYGTRHRAAIGMSESSDCTCLVVSEETGDVSVAVDGMIKKYDDISELREDLLNILGYNENKDNSLLNFNFSNVWNFKKEKKHKKQVMNSQKLEG